MREILVRIGNRKGGNLKKMLNGSLQIQRTAVNFSLRSSSLLSSHAIPRTCNICSPAREYVCRCDATRVPAPMFARI